MTLGDVRARAFGWACDVKYLVPIILFSMLIAGCGGGGGGSSSAAVPEVQAAEDGEVLIGLTDAEGDYLTYAVDVLRLTLEKANGDVVETLPLATTVDFAELTEVTEFLTIATVPAGVYTSASLVLDFSAAEIVVQNDAGEPVAVTAVDTDGAVLGELEVRLSLDGTETIRIAPGLPAAFSLDFDLDASNEIDLTSAPPTVTVEPFLLAMAELERGRAHRARGALADVDEAAAEFTLKVRPFRHRAGEFGRLTLETDGDTVYELDGEAFLGAEGLAALAAMPENTPVVAGVRIADAGLLADTVLAGTSVQMSGADAVHGVVSARTDDAVTVRGAVTTFADGVARFRGEVTVLLGEDTTVSALGVPAGTLTKDDVSVGSRVIAFGELTDELTLDVAAGQVRLPVSQLTAQVAQASPLAVSLFYLNGRRPEVFDFAGTGVDDANDAEPSFYEIQANGLGGSLEAGDLVRVRGLVRPYGLAPEDFEARTVIDVDTEARAAALAVTWADGTSMPFLATDPARLDLDLAEASVRIKVRGVPIDFVTPLGSLALAAPETGRGVYAVLVRGSGELRLYREFADLVAALTEALDDGNVLHRIGAHGSYNTERSELTAHRASFVLGAE